MLLKPRDLEGLEGRIAIDIENDTRANFKATPGMLLGLGVWSPDNGIYGYVPTPTVKDEERLKRAVRTWRSGSWLIAHNIKYELQWLGIDPDEVHRFNLLDTMVAEHLLHEEWTNDLASCESRRLKQRSKRQILDYVKAETGHTIKQIAQWPTKLAAEYCINDCRITWELAEVQMPRLRLEGLDQLFLHSMEYTKVLYRAERRGMLVDRVAAGSMAQQVKDMTKLGMQRLAEASGTPLKYLPNLNSPPQLSKWLYEDLGLERPQLPPELASSPKAKQYNTATGTGKDLLKQIDHPAPRMVLDIRQVAKVRSYLNSYMKLGDEVEEGWVVRPSFNQTGTVTGRLSCSSPNLQQVSAKMVGESFLQPGERGIFLRHVFKARPGYRIVGIDYKQMEVVGFGILSGERTLLKLIGMGGDVHERVSHLMFDGYDPTKRKVVKTLNFGLLYGLGDAGMAEMMGMPLEETRRLKSMYLATFSGVRPWMVRTEEQLKRHGYVRYWSGRKRRIKQEDGWYKGVNALVQGGCADILMMAALRVDEYLRSFGDGYIVALVHDELVLELPEDSLKETVPAIQELMAVPDLLGTAFGTDVSIGRVWDEDAL